MSLQQLIQQAQADFDAMILKDLGRAADAALLSNIISGKEDANLEQWLTYEDDGIRKFAKQRHEWLSRNPK